MERKNIPDPGFAADDGTADPVLAAALAAWQQDPSAEPELLAALTPSRLMVPIVALLGEVEVDAHGHQHEKTSDMAVPVLEAADGRRALPAFTSMESMTRWRADARPAPVVAPQAAMVAYAERADVLLIDPAGPVSYQLSGARLRAVAENRPYLRPHLDPEVHRALRELLGAVPEITAAHLVPAPDADATLALVLADPATDPRTLAARLGPALAADDALRLRLDQGIQLAFLAKPLEQQPFYVRG
ncbi:SseB family protein [Kitasatospora sp. NPDC088134]|uniref:SseB family protein n=1 Tax=Kitasatospora sp. NPDC088134 TaxID=3364071 RepID=UPI0038238A0B